MKKSNKKRLLLVVFVLLAVLGATYIWRSSSSFTSHLLPSPSSQSNGKGYELYSWMENGEWYYSLLPATDKSKTVDEVKKNPDAVKGGTALQAKIRTLPQKEPVVWLRTIAENGIFAELRLPPDEQIEEIRKVIEGTGWELKVSPPYDS